MTGCRHFVISGRVQGVYFRQSTLEIAQQLDLTGWVRNLPDGQVEVMAQGSIDSLAELEQWLHVGPTMAKVSAVISDIRPEDPALSMFQIDV